MDELIRKADVLIEALPYIQRFRGETIVVKFGGSAMEEKKYSDGILADVIPTLLDMMGREKPAEMTGTSLIVR